MIALLALLAQLPAPPPPAVVSRTPVRVAGQVLLGREADSLPAPGAMVLLHRVGPSRQGPIDSVLSDAAGRFAMRFRPDTGALYLISARYRGIEYFAPPVSRDAAHPDLAVTVLVYDTSSTVPLVVASRHFVVGRPDPSGVRNVADLVLLENAGSATRLAGDSLHPTWRMLLPSRALGVEVGESDFSSDALVQRADTLFLNASVPPGTRQFTLTYHLAAGETRLEIPIDHDVPAADILSEDPALVARGGLTREDTVSVVGRTFTKWDGALQSGTPLVLEFTADTPIPGWVLPALIAALGLGLIGLSVTSARRRAASAPLVMPVIPAPDLGTDAEALLTRIAELDAAHAGGAAGVSPEAWQEYLRERARLKDRLRALLPR